MYHLHSHLFHFHRDLDPFISFLFFIFTHSLSALSTPPLEILDVQCSPIKTQKWTNNCEGEVNPQSTHFFHLKWWKSLRPHDCSKHSQALPSPDPTSNPPLLFPIARLPPAFLKTLSPVCLPETLEYPSPGSPVSDIFAAKATFQSPSSGLCLKHLTAPSSSPLATVTPGLLGWILTFLATPSHYSLGKNLLSTHRLQAMETWDVPSMGLQLALLPLCVRANYIASVVPDSATLWTAAHQAPLFLGFSRQGYCSGLPCSPLGDLPDPGTEPEALTSPALAGGFFTSSATTQSLNVSVAVGSTCSLLFSSCYLLVLSNFSVFIMKFYL